MSLPFGLSFPQAAIGVGAAVALLIARNYGPNVLQWWFLNRRDRLDRVRKWHRDLQRHLSKTRSVGRRLQHGRITDISKVEDLVSTTVEMEAMVNPEPVEVKVLVDDEVRAQVRTAVGLSYHLAHLPKPDEKGDSVAGLLYHQYRILEKMGSDTSVKMDKVLEVIGEIRQPAELEISEEEAERILEDFENESRKRVENMEDMTIDELMELPWEKVDEIVTLEARQRLIEYIIEQYYEISLLKKPGEAKSKLERSEEELFG